MVGVRIFLILLVLKATAHAAVLSHDCGQSTHEGYQYSWCIDAQPGSKNNDVIFAFHGAGDSEQSWAAGFHGRAITAALSKRAGDLPTVISVSFGPTWLITDLAPAIASAALPNAPPAAVTAPPLTEEFFDTILPELETRAVATLNIRPARRFILGLSMGSFNAAQLFFRRPEKFDRLVMMCAAIQKVGAFSNPQAIQTAIASHSFIRPQDYLGFLSWIERTMQTPANWQRHDLLAFAQSMPSTIPPFYVTVGRQDEYGFFDGAEEFASIAASRGLPVTWKPLDGGHCAYDADDIAAFLYPATVTTKAFASPLRILPRKVGPPLSSPATSQALR